MLITDISFTDASAAAPARSALSSEQHSLEINLTSLANSRVRNEVHISPIQVAPAGQNRLQSITGVNTGHHAHAAVRMHDFLAKGYFWAFCPKTKTRHSQRSKVAT